MSLLSAIAAVGASIVDEDVDAAPLGFHFFEQILSGLEVAQVDSLGHDFVVGVDLLEGGQSLGAGLLIVAQEANLCAAGQEALDSCKADTTAAAGDDYYFTVELILKHWTFSFLLKKFVCSGLSRSPLRMPPE